MKKTVNRLVKENILLLLPLIFYGIYKNGYLIYQKELINFILIFKPIFLVLINIVIKTGLDFLIYKKIKIDYNFVYVILIGMIMPYNINIIMYLLLFTIAYYLSLLLDKILKINKVCLIYIFIITIHFIFNDFSFFNPLEQNYAFSFEFLDYLFGRNIGSISTTSIFLSLLAFIYLINTYYYKKDIPFVINLVYLILAFIYFILTDNSALLLNSELIFASIFIAPLPEYSPYKKSSQIIYGILIGSISFLISITFNSILAIYISILIISTLYLLISRQKLLK